MSKVPGLTPEQATVIGEIQKIIQYFIDNKVASIQDGDYVANLIVKLASYNATLGTFVADLERAADMGEAHFDLVKEQRYKEARRNLKFKDTTGKEKAYTQDDADNFKRLESQDEKGAWLEAKYAYRLASILRADAKNLIDALRSKLSYMKQERQDS